MSNIRNYIKKAEKYYAAHNFGDAIYWYTRAIGEDPKMADLYSERAVAFFHNKQLGESLQDMNAAQVLEPKNAYRYSSRAYIRDAMGDLKGAIEDYQVAIRLDPDDAIAHNNLGLLTEKMGHRQQAQVFFDFADRLAKEQGMTGDKAPEGPRNIQRDIDKSKDQQSLAAEMGKVFTSKQTFKEFIRFIKNGFKAEDQAPQ